jgi:DNA-binding MarR family transcriptional regulator
MDELGQVKHLDDFLRLVPVFMKRLSHSFHDDADAVHRFTHAQFRVLVLTAQRESWRMSDLAHRMALSPGSLTLMMDRLIEDGLISRGRSEQDRRVVIVQITEKGREILAARRRGLHGVVASYIAKMPPKEREDLVQALGTVAKFLERHVSEL